MESQNAKTNVAAPADRKSRGLEILEKNITGVPVTESQLRKLYEAFTSDGSESVSEELLVTFYNSLDHIGVPLTEREVRAAVAEYAQTTPNGLTFPEFACFMLKISQW